MKRLRNRRFGVRDIFVHVGVEGFMTIRELEKYLGLDRRTIYRYSGKYHHKPFRNFPAREGIAGQWRWKIYDIDLWLGRIKAGDKLPYMEMVKKERLCGIKEVEIMLEYHPEYIRTLCKRGIIPAYKSKVKWLFIPSEVQDWARREGRVL